ncbi:MAG: sulfatase-like hydrolase/transferase [Lentisphaerae bacterium]|nr:sulfatase-like hydrolase/transferase [Lentisphaerota bacterium]
MAAMSVTPNIIVITTDQQRRDSLQAYGATFTRTPGTNRLAAEGVVCERAYCTNPVCTPARASLFSGQYLSRHGAWNVGTTVPDDTVMIMHRLAGAGYQTHNIGKIHFQPMGMKNPDAQSVEALLGWRERFPAYHGPYYGFERVELALGHTEFGIAGHYGAWVEAQAGGLEAVAALNSMTQHSRFYFGGEAYDWNLPTRLHNSVWTADRTIAFLRERDPARPFFLAVGFEDPHHPHCLPTDYPGRLPPETVPLPRFTPGELDDKPPHFLSAHHGRLKEDGVEGAFMVAGQGRGGNYAAVSPEEARLGRAYYYSMCKLLDEQLDRILAALDDQGLAEHTIVVFTTDHGELLGDHGLWMKGPFHYEELVRVPLIVRWPAGLPAGQRVNGLLSHVDLVPTLLAACGLPAAAALDGVNALPLLRGETPAARDAAIVECTDDPAALRLKTIVTAEHKLTMYHGRDDGELYDLVADPGELRNLWTSSAHGGIRERLLHRLLDHAEPLERRAARSSYA